MNLTITLFQTELAWEDKQANLARFTALINTAEPSDLMILPEMFSTGFSMRSVQLAESMDGQTVTWMQDQAIRAKSTICGSVIIAEGEHFFNRFLWINPDGEIQHYDKKHLFRMSEENENYSAGKNRLIVQLRGFRLCPQVCYDLRFPVFSRNVRQSKQDSDQPYDVLLYVANWPAARSTHWRALLQARAIENQSYVVGVNRIGQDGKSISYQGDSCVINPQGEFLVDLSDKDCSYTMMLDKTQLTSYRARFPAWKDSDLVEFR